MPARCDPLSSPPQSIPSQTTDLGPASQGFFGWIQFGGEVGPYGRYDYEEPKANPIEILLKLPLLAALPVLLISFYLYA